jgi:hypothetical protein
MKEHSWCQVLILGCWINAYCYEILVDGIIAEIDCDGPKRFFPANRVRPLENITV